MEPTRSTIGLSWGDVSVLEWAPSGDGAGPRPDVLLLHGGGLDSASLSWRGLGGTLASAGYRVVAPDHPGFGRSPRAPWTATQERLVAYVAELTGALDLRSYVAGGLSLGGGLTIGHALDRPPGLVGAMLFGSYGLMGRQYTGAGAGPAHLATWAAVRTGALDAIGRATTSNRAMLERSLRGALQDADRRTPELVDEVAEAAARPGAFEVFGEWQRDQYGPRRLRTDYRDRLREVDVPTLVVHGERDAGVPVDVARDAARALPDARLVVVPGAGHWVQRDRPEAVEPAVLAFLEGVRAAV